MTNKILVVDDENSIRLLLKIALEKRGYQVSEAENGKIAINYLQRHPADLMIIDMIMPEKEGIETIREVRKTNAKIKIIAVSGGGLLGPDAYLMLAGTLGADATMPKPIALKDLLQQVSSLLQNTD